MPTTMVPKRKKKTGSISGNNSLNGSVGNFTESAMDEFLSKQGLYRKPIAKDGSCLFRAVSEEVHNCQEKHRDVRNRCIDFMRENRAHFEEFVEGPFDHHLYKLQNPKEWAGQVEITALSQIYSKDFIVYQDINSPPTKVTDHGYKDKILLCYSNGNHYDIIYNSKYQEHAAMCQSLLFEVLYNRVFAELDKKETSKKGPKPKGSVSSSHSNPRNIMDWMNGSGTNDGDMIDNGGDDDGWTEVKSKARAKHERQSKSVEVEEEKEQEEAKTKGNNEQKYLWELRRSVDPHLYRNIPLEVWEEDKHVLQQKDLAVAASLQYKNGERCSVKLGPPTVPTEKCFNAFIKEDYSGSGNIQVFVPELSKRHLVPIQSISSQQGTNYKELSGHYQKDNGPASEEGTKDDSKFKKKRPPRNRRGPGKGGDEAGNATEDVVPRGRGKQRDRYNRRRFPGKDDRNSRDMKDEEEARFMAEQIKLVELQEKDPTAFPALPVRGSSQVSPSTPSCPPAVAPVIKTVEKEEIVPLPVKEEKVQEKEKIPTPKPDESSPAGFWSKFNKSPRQASEESKPPNPAVAKQQEPDECSALPGKIDNESHAHSEETLIEEQIAMMEVNDNDNGKQTEVNDLESQSNADKEIQKPFNVPLQIKPIPGDSKHNKNIPHMFEVKIPETGPSSLQPVKITHKNVAQEEPSPHLEHSEMESVFTQAEPENEAQAHEEPQEILANNELSGMAGLTIKDNHEMSSQYQSVKEPFEMPSSSEKVITLNSEESLSYQETNFQQEEPVSKIAKSRVNDSAGNPERKTVTFSEETKEIPDVPYGQSQKGILIVNGTNRPSQVGDQGYKPSNPDDYTSLTKENSKPEYVNTQDSIDKDPQGFQTVIGSEGLQSSSPATQQQPQLPPYLLTFLPPNVQIPARPSMDPNGTDLPSDIPTLRHFFNLGYQYHMMLANQLANQQVPMMYMYQGTIQDQIMSQAGQPVATMPQQPIYAGMQHQQLAFQHPGLQTYPPPFHMPPQTTQDSSSQIDRTTDRVNQPQHQPQIQPQQQMQMPQQSGHFQQPQNQMPMWRSATAGGNSNNNNRGGGRHYNPHKFPHHVQSNTNRSNWSQGSGGNPRQPHSNSKQNHRKIQGGKVRSEHFNQQHFENLPHSQSMPGHNVVTPSQSGYFAMTSEHQSKGHNAQEYYASNVFNYTQMQPGGMTNLPHHTR